MFAITVGVLGLTAVVQADPLSAVFTYQGRLDVAGAPLTDTADFEFTLWDAASGGNMISTAFPANHVMVVDGAFSVDLNFGVSAFDGDARWLEISVRSPAGGGTFATLTPRQPLRAAPYALQTRGIVVANNGNVAIGTTSSAERLTVAASADPAVRVENLGSGSAAVQLAAADYEWEWRMKSANNLGLFDTTAGNVERLTIDTAGNVGIGNASPTSRLDVGGTVTATGFSGDGSGLTGLSLNSLNAADGSPADAVFVDNTGAVGIGTTTPLSEMHLSAGTPEILLDATTSGATGVVFQNTDYSYSIRMTSGEKFVLRDVTAGNIDRLSIDTAGKVDVGNLTVLPTGEVGIGTGSPATALAISYNGAAPIGITQGQLGGNGMELTTRDASGGQPTRFKINAAVDSPDIEFYNGARGAEWKMGRIGSVQDGGRIGLSTLGGIETVMIQAAETSTTGAQLDLRDAGGVSRITLDADFNGEGRVIADVIQINGGADIAEPFDVYGADAIAVREIEPGMVVAIDPANPGALRLANRAYDRTVAGVISGAGGVKPGMMLQQPGTAADGKHPVALTGRVWCYVDADRGGVQPGDLLTTSDTPGHAMKVDDHDRALGAIIGKAMSSLDRGRGLVLVLVSLQ